MLSGPCPQEGVQQGACRGRKCATSLCGSYHAFKIFQSCKKVPKEVPVAREVCNKEPVEVNNFLKFESQNIKYQHFRAASRCPKRFPFPRRSAPKSLSRSLIPVCLNIFANVPIFQSCSQVPTKVCRNVAVSVPRTVARRVCRH